MVKDPRFNSHWSLKDNSLMYLTSLFIRSGCWSTSGPYPDWYHHSLYTGQRRYKLLLYYPEFLELGTGTCKASDSSMLREGDCSHFQDTTILFCYLCMFNKKVILKKYIHIYSCYDGCIWVEFPMILLYFLLPGSFNTRPEMIRISALHTQGMACKLQKYICQVL